MDIILSSLTVIFKSASELPELWEEYRNISLDMSSSRLQHESYREQEYCKGRRECTIMRSNCPVSCLELGGGHPFMCS